MPFWYGVLLNPIKNGGYWKYRSKKKLQKEMNRLAKAIKVFTSEQIAKF